MPSPIDYGITPSPASLPQQSVTTRDVLWYVLYAFYDTKGHFLLHRLPQFFQLLSVTDNNPRRSRMILNEVEGAIG